VKRALLFIAALALAQQAAADAPPIGRLFYTPAQRAALEDARTRNIRAEEQANAASKQPAAPRSRDVVLSGVVQRSDGESFAWVNGKSVEGQTSDGLRVRHTAQPNRILVYDPDKRRMVQVKVGQRADLITGRVQESYERKKQAPPEPEALPAEAAEMPATPAPAKKTARTGDTQDEHGEAR
jgi:hypothetical protein